MEAFESVCKVALEADDFVVSNNVKFPLRRRTRKTAYEEWQTHGYEVDLVGTRHDELVLASCKSYLGSSGVGPRALTPGTKESSGYRMLVDAELRRDLTEAAHERYGYSPEQIRFRLYAGRLVKGTEAKVQTLANGLTVKLVELPEIIERVLKAAGPTTYLDDPVVMTVKALYEAGKLNANLPDYR